MSAKYYTMDFIVNDIVYISFNQKLETIGIEDTEGYFKVMGHDHMGMWQKHPGIMHFPDREGCDFEGVFDKNKIGFSSKK